jgi:zona occludens toxin (predicted ATPase)
MKKVLFILALVFGAMSVSSYTIQDNPVEVCSDWTVGASVSATYIGPDGNGDEDYSTTVATCKSNGAQMKVSLADGTIGVMNVGDISFSTPKFVYTLD